MPSRHSDLRFVVQLALLVAALGNGALCAAGDWPQWLGPDRNGVSGETLAPWTGEPRIAWKQSVGNGFSVPVVAGGRLFVHAAVEGQEAEVVIAFDADSGQELWRDEYPRDAYQSELGSGPRATPTVLDGRLYTIGITGVMSCYDAATGRRLWRTNPYTELQANRPGFGVCSSPLVVGERVILPVGGEGSGVVGYDALTGEIAWKALDEPAAAASPVLLQREAGAAARPEVVVQSTLRLAGVDPQDGTIRWEHPLVFQPSGVSPTPLVVDGLLVCSTQDNGTLALKLPTSETSQPELAWWNQDVSSYFSTGTLDNSGRVLIVTNGFNPLPRADLRCIDVRSGEERWRKDNLGYFHFGLIRLSDGRLLLLDDAGKLILADAGPEGFRELCRAKVCGGTFCNPVLAEGRVYVRDRSQIVCLDLRSPIPNAAPAAGSN